MLNFSFYFLHIGASKDILISSNDNMVLAGIDTPEPVFFCAIESPSASDQKRFDEALERLAREDPSLQISIDPESQQTILRGMGELQIEIVKDRMRTDFGLDVYLGPIQINYKVKQFRVWITFILNYLEMKRIA